MLPHDYPAVTPQVQAGRRGQFHLHLHGVDTEYLPQGSADMPTIGGVNASQIQRETLALGQAPSLSGGHGRDDLTHENRRDQMPVAGDRQQLANLMHSVAVRMRVDFERSKQFRHHGQAGATRETLVRNFVSDYLPAHVEAIHSAEIVSVGGATSSECDIVVCDKSTPRLLDMEDYRVIPNECVYGVLEVKSRLNKPELLDACAKIKRAKMLAKTAYYRDAHPVRRDYHGRKIDYFPTHGIIFAFDSIELKRLANHLIAWCSDNPAEFLPDSIWVLGKGFLQWTNPENGNIDRRPEYEVGLLVARPAENEDVLFPMVVHLNMAFADARMAPLKLGQYAGRDPFGTVVAHWPKATRPPGQPSGFP